MCVSWFEYKANQQMSHCLQPIRNDVVKLPLSEPSSEKYRESCPLKKHGQVLKIDPIIFENSVVYKG